MWDFLADLVREICLTDRLRHTARWSGFRRHSECLSGQELVDEVLLYLDTRRNFKFAVRGHAVYLCQRLVNLGVLARVSTSPPSDLDFSESPHYFWRLLPLAEGRVGTFRNPLLMAHEPFVGRMDDFPSKGERRYGMITEDSILFIFKTPATDEPPKLGVCLSQFSITVTSTPRGELVRLGHPHSRLADIEWYAESALEAQLWLQHLEEAVGRVSPYGRPNKDEATLSSVVALRPKSPKKFDVVVVGGGYCGVHTAKALQEDFNVTLIDTKHYFENTPSVLKAMVDPHYQKYIYRDYSFCLPKCTVHMEKLQRLTTGRVLLERETVPYDFLVIATGSSYRTDLIKSEMSILPTRNATLRSTNARLEAARRVLIIGGGIVGVELSAEIIFKYPTKEVILVESGPRLIQRFSTKASRKCEEWLRRHNVQLHLGHRVVEALEDNRTFKMQNTQDGSESTIKDIDIDFICTGVVPNTDFLQNDPVFHNVLKDSDPLRGYINVNDNLQMMGHEGFGGKPPIFAGGDCTAILEEKLAQSAEIQSEIIARNIRAMAAGAIRDGDGVVRQWGAVTAKYTPPTSQPGRTVIISLGPNDGVMIPKMGGDLLMTTGWVAACGKGFAEYSVMKGLTPTKFHDQSIMPPKPPTTPNEGSSAGECAQ